jgi:RNase P/RNase MRP subunit p30
MNIITELNPDKVRREIDKLAGKHFPVVQGNKIDFNRKILENKKVKALVLMHKGQKDSLKERGSGLNQVLAKICRDSGKIIFIDFKEIIETEGIEKAKILGRLMQNIMLLQKYNVKTGIINKSGRDNYDLFSFLLTLGANTKFAKITAFTKYE